MTTKTLSKKHVHIWKIESANGPTSRGVCGCGAELAFYNFLTIDKQWKAFMIGHVQQENDVWGERITEAVAQARKEVFKGTLQMHIVSREKLSDVGEWAECQDVGVFVWFPQDIWQAIQSEKESK